VGTPRTNLVARVLTVVYKNDAFCSPSTLETIPSQLKSAVQIVALHCSSKTFARSWNNSNPAPSTGPKDSQITFIHRKHETEVVFGIISSPVDAP
jgi:hypothetical protein